MNNRLKAIAKDHIHSSPATLGRSALLQRKCSCGDGAGLSSSCEGCEKKQLQRRASDQSRPDGIPQLVHDVVNGVGQPLDRLTRSFMESRFGHDFSKVRIHADDRAAEAARAVNSYAFTVGANVVFGPGKYEPNTESGRRLLAHELSHVVQQDHASTSHTNELRLNMPADRHEREADRVANAVMTPHVAVPVLSQSGPGLQRSIQWMPGTVSEELNLAQRFVITGQRHAGNTELILNGTRLSAATTLPTVEAALKKPTFKSVPRGTKKAVDCSLDVLPHNEATYDTKVITGGKWQQQTTKKRMAELFPALKVCKKSSGDTILTIKENDDVRAATRRHEEQHAIDDKDTFNAIVGAWDNALTNAQKNNSTASGSDAADCENNFYTSVIHATPAHIARRLLNDINLRAARFHRTAAGQDVVIYDVVEGTDCNAVRAKVR